jgi:hypothetical protein
MGGKIRVRLAGVMLLLGVGALSGIGSSGQEQPKREVIQATARGQLRGSGKLYSITINIESYSTPTDQKTLIDAFNSGGHDGLVKALSGMSSRGRVAVEGTLGYQIAYIHSVSGANGRTLRLLTDRPIQAGEALVGGRSKPYDLSGIELNLANDKKKSEGYLALAGKFKQDKTGQITWESLGSAWKLVNIQER